MGTGKAIVRNKNAIYKKNEPVAGGDAGGSKSMRRNEIGHLVRYSQNPHSSENEMLKRVNEASANTYHG